MAARTRRQLVLFAVITVTGVLYVAIRYAGAAPLVGLGPTEVRLELADAAGLTVKNEVTYRGLEIGEVGSVRPTPTGVEAAVHLDRGSPPVPASAVAVVALRSAIGEVYVDLQPTDAGPPFLTEGSVVPRERTRLPFPIESVLTNLNAFAASVPVSELRTTVDELDNAFDRTGPDLQRLLDSSNLLTADAVRALPRTRGLLRDGRVVLDTQSRLGPQLTSFSRDLQLLSHQIERDDPALRRLVNRAPRAAAQLEGLIRETGPDLSRTVANLLTVSGILRPRLAGLEQFLVTGAFAASIGNTVLPGDGRLHFGLVVNIDDPPPCRDGYLQPDGGWRPATAQEPLPVDTAVRCNESPPVNARGAQNAPSPDGDAAAPARPGGSAPPPSSSAVLPPVAVSPEGVLGDGRTGPPIVIPGMTPGAPR